MYFESSVLFRVEYVFRTCESCFDSGVCRSNVMLLMVCGDNSLVSFFAALASFWGSCLVQE